jgi:protein-disulfide isomerase
MKREMLVAGALAALVALFAVGLVVVKSQRAEEIEVLAEQDMTLFERPGAPSHGPEDADVVIVEFFDPACETCAALYPHVHALVDAHPERVRLVLRYAALHQGADVVVRVLEASRKQDLFWETLDVLFKTQSQWTAHHQVRPDLLPPILIAAGLDMDRLNQDMGDPAIDAAMQQDNEDRVTLGARKTPTFFVNGKPLPSFGLEQLKVLVQSELDGG